MFKNVKKIYNNVKKVPSLIDFEKLKTLFLKNYKFEQFTIFFFNFTE